MKWIMDFKMDGESIDMLNYQKDTPLKNSDQSDLEKFISMTNQANLGSDFARVMSELTDVMKKNLENIEDARGYVTDRGKKQ